MLLVVSVSTNKMLRDCLMSKRRYMINVVHLEDNTYESRPYVQHAVEKAIEADKLENEKRGMDQKHFKKRLHRLQASNRSFRGKKKTS